MSVERLDRRERMAAETRSDILEAARRLFAERGYAATSVGDIAREAGVAVQTIYSRLGSKRGMLMALVDLIEQEAGRPQAAERVFAAKTPEAVLRASIQLTRGFQERCGDVIGALFTAAGAEEDLAAVVADGRSRHRQGARLTIERIAAMGGLRDGLRPEWAAALFTAATSYESWHELVHDHGISWDEAEDWLVDALGRAVLDVKRGASRRPVD
jgi:AcrR family transcriptional regulator